MCAEKKQTRASRPFSLNPTGTLSRRVPAQFVCAVDNRSGRIEAHRDYLLGLIRRTPDITLLEIRERLIANCGERFSSSVLWRFFDRHEITVQKKTAHAEEQQRADVLRQRRVWFTGQPTSIL